MVCPGRQPQSVESPLKGSCDIGGGTTVPSKLRRTHLAIGKDHGKIAEALDLSVSDLGDAFTHEGCPLARPVAGEFSKRNRRNLDVEVNSIEEWAGDLRSISLHVQWVTSAAPRLISIPPTRTRVHSFGKYEACGVPKGRTRPRMGDHAVLQGLS